MKCNISGQVGDWESTACVVPLGQSPRDAIAEFEISHGQFSGSFEGDPQLAYDLIVLNPDHSSYTVCSFFADRSVAFAWDDNSYYKLSVIPGGRNNKSLSALLRASTAPIEDRYLELDARRAEMEDDRSALTDEARRILSALESDTTSADRAAGLNDSLSILIKEKKLYTTAYQDVLNDRASLMLKHTQYKMEQMRRKVNPASFMELYKTLLQECSTYDNIESYVDFTPEMAEQCRSDISSLQEIYASQYSDKFQGHPFHDAISRQSSRPKALEGKVKYTDFTLPDSDGVPRSLSSIIDGKVAVVDFWASWCAGCRRTALSMVPLWEEYHDKGLAVVGVAREYGNDKAWREALRTDRCPWPQLLALDADHTIWEKYGISNAAGGVFLVDKEGTIIKVDPSIEDIESALSAAAVTAGDA